MAAHQASPSLGFSRQEHWSGLPFPSPMHESEKWKWSRSVVSDFSNPMDCSLPGSTVPGILQARTQEWVAISFSIALTIWTFVSKVISLFFDMLSRFVIASLPRIGKHLLISWLQSLSAVILEPKKIKSVIASTFSLFICHEVMGLDAMVLVFECLLSSQLFHSPLSPSSRGSLIPLHFLPLKWYHLHIWGCWYFSWQSWFYLVSHLSWHFTWCILHIS